MITKINKNEIREKRHSRQMHGTKHGRTINSLVGTAQRPRLNVYRSACHIYAQIINDDNGTTLVSCNTLQKDVKENLKNLTKKEQARLVGKMVGEKAIKANIKEVVFDRGGYLYTGRVKELADGAREAGLVF